MFDSVTVRAGCAFAVDERERFLLSCVPVLESEVRRAARFCRHYDSDDLYGEGMLFLCEKVDRLQVGEKPLAYVRIALRQHLWYVRLLTDGLIRTPRARTLSEQQPAMMCLSLETPLRYGDGEGGRLGDVLAEETRVAPDADVERLRLALDTLTERQREAVLARFGSSGSRLRSYAEVAELLGVPRTVAYDAVASGLAKLRRALVPEREVAA